MTSARPVTLFVSVVVCAVLLARVQCRYAGQRDNRVRRVSASDENETIHKVHRKSGCGYDSCPVPKPGMLNVHLVPHTHDDVGWLKTVDQYYYGSRNNIQKAGVQYIIDSVIDELLKDPAKKFIYVESAFLMKWWSEQQPERQRALQQLVEQGRLELVGGAWSMNDEAVTHYQSIVDQFTWGFKHLNSTLGACGRPRVGWQIDPFGHSREQASIFARLGFDGMFLGRLDYQDKMRRLEHKEAEMLWHASDDLGEAADLFTGVLYNNYGPPPGFCFDILCQDEPIIDDKRSYDYNVDERINSFINYVNMQAASYKTDNIILTMGEDFNYQLAHPWFQNMDKLIMHTNARQTNGSRVNAFYSTPSCYLSALHDAGRVWPTKRDDFFPYASDPHTYWTGYFTSRPTIKWFERVANNMLQVCKQVHSLTSSSDPVELKQLRSALGIMQHHDAITGTEKQHVADDYSKILDQAVQGCADASAEALRKIFSGGDKASPKLDLQTCPGLNVSACEISETKDSFVVTLYNPLASERKQFVRLPVEAPQGTKFTVLDHAGESVATQLVPIPSYVQTIPGRKSVATAELVFLADLPAVGSVSYWVTKQKSKPEVQDSTTSDYLYADVSQMTKKEGLIVIGTPNLSASVDSLTGQVSHTSFSGAEFPLHHQFLYYRGASGDNEEFKNRSSGAYIFRANGTVHDIVPKDAKLVDFKVVTGDLVDEVHQTWNDWVHQTVRVYKRDVEHVEFDWTVGPIPDNKDLYDGKEVISRFSSNLVTGGHFQTDSNGRELIARRLDHRDTWNVSIVEKEGGNYYPITSMIKLVGMCPTSDRGISLAVIPDRAQGGSSLADGQIELMVHRRLFRDDAFGVGEALNETAFGAGLVARGTHYVIAADTEDEGIAARQRVLAQEVLLPATAFFSNAENLSLDQWKKQTHKYSSLKAPLPAGLHLMTLEPWANNQLLLRLEHFLERYDHPQWSLPITVDLKKLFSAFTVKSVRETTLGANQWLDEAERFKWKTDEKKQEEENFAATYKMSDDFIPMQGTNVTLRPMEIRTFILDI